MLEKILAVLTALVAAIEANTAAQLKGASAPAEEKKTRGGKAAAETKTETAAAASTTAASTPAAPTVADVRSAATAFLEAQTNKEEQAKFMSSLNGKYGTKRISEAPADKFGEIIAALNAEIARLKAPATAADSI